MNKEFIEKQLKLSKRQNKDERYDYLCSEFNAINYCANLEKYTNKLQQESQKLQTEKEQINSLVNSCQEEIRRLKKQLEEYKRLGFKHLNDKCNKLENQQKKFIDYLENEIYSIEPKGTGINYNCEYDSEEDYISAMKEQSKLNTLKEILSKYQEIIGSDINVGSIDGKE